MAEQLTLEQRLGKRGAVELDERLFRARMCIWIACATSSFPVPLSPVMRTVARVGATRSIV